MLPMQRQKSLACSAARIAKGQRQARPAAFLGRSDNARLDHVAQEIDRLKDAANTTNNNLLSTVTTLTGRVDERAKDFSDSVDAKLETQLGNFASAVNAKVDAVNAKVDSKLDSLEKTTKAQFSSLYNTAMTLGSLFTLLVAGWAAWTGTGKAWPFPPSWALVGAFLLGYALIAIHGIVLPVLDRRSAKNAMA